jgi:hypothetical protein
MATLLPNLLLPGAIVLKILALGSDDLFLPGGKQNRVLLHLVCTTGFFIAKFEPVIPEQLDWMLRTFTAVAAIHGVG